MQKVSIVVPCYNEAENIKEFYRRTKSHLDIPEYSFHFIFINDGSKDHTLEELKDLKKECPDVGFVSFSRNFGKEAALLAGLEKSRGNDAVIMIDADLQHNPKYIPEMLRLREEGYKIVYTKKSKRNESFVKKLLTKIFYIFFFKTTKLNLEPGLNDYMLLDKMALEAFLQIGDKERFTKGIFTHVGFRKKCLAIDIEKRHFGKTKWSFRKLFNYAFTGVNQFSECLLIIPKFGFFIAFLFTAFNVYQYLDKKIATKEFMVLLQLDIMVMLLFISLYFAYFLIYNTRKEVRKRPIYIVEEEEDSSEND